MLHRLSIQVLTSIDRDVSKRERDTSVTLYEHFRFCDKKTILGQRSTYHHHSITDHLSVRSAVHALGTGMLVFVARAMCYQCGTLLIVKNFRLTSHKIQECTVKHLCSASTRLSESYKIVFERLCSTPTVTIQIVGAHS